MIRTVDRSLFSLHERVTSRGLVSGFTARANLAVAERSFWQFHSAYVDTYHISFLDWVRNPAVLRDVCISCCDSQHITDWTDVLWTWLHKYLITPCREVTKKLNYLCVINLSCFRLYQTQWRRRAGLIRIRVAGILHLSFCSTLSQFSSVALSEAFHFFIQKIFVLTTP